jgi:hypothetical protein
MKNDWGNYTIEFLSVFIAVISAFALNNWNDYRKESLAETKILSEIRYGIEKDLDDVRQNIFGHEQGMKACTYWRNAILGKSIAEDSAQAFYLTLTRDFISVQNTSGYETLKSRGLELISNDSLRQKVISLYEYDYNTLKVLEEEYPEMQFQDNYFHEFNRIISPYLEFDDRGNILRLRTPLSLSETDKQLMMTYLWKIQVNRRFIMMFYYNIEMKIQEVMKDLDVELGS